MKTRLIPALGALAIFFDIATVNMVRAEAPVVPVAARQSVGTISAFGANAISLRSETSERATRYSSSSTTTFMDENGAPVPLVMLKPGVPVSIDYVRVGDRLIARRVIVMRSLTAGPAIVQKKEPFMTAAVESN